MKHNDGGPVVAIDIDGTLGDYHGHFLHFAEGWYGRKMPSPKDINPGLPLHKFMRTGKSTYRQCKLAYRQGGLKRSMPCYDGASELTRTIRKAGAELWICTTRPYLRLDNIDPDTRHWLRRNRIQYDAVIYGEGKYRDLVRNVGRDRVAAVMDDLPEMCIQAKNLGLPVLMRNQPYNREALGPQQRADGLEVRNFWRADDMWEATAKLLFYIRKWQEQNGRRVGMGPIPIW